MRRIILMTLTALTLTGGVALADRGGRWRDTSHRQGGTVVTPTHRHTAPRYERRYDNRRYDNHRHRVVRVERARPTFRNNRFYFTGGYYRPYTRPVINVRYRDYYRRPAVIVENIQPVAGYVWNPGHWEWAGAEWQWIPGHYDVDPNYQTYDNSYYDNSGYYDNGGYYNNGATIQGGISVGGSVNF